MIVVGSQHIANAAIEKHWPATPTSGYDGCDGCPVMSSCPYREQLALRPEAEIRDGNAEEIAALFVYAKTFAKAAERGLKHHVATEGPIPMPAGKVMGYVKKTKRMLDLPREVYDALVTAGVDEDEIWKHIKMGVGAAYELLDTLAPEKRGPVLEELTIQVVEEEHQEFRVHEARKPKKKKAATPPIGGRTDAVQTTET